MQDMTDDMHEVLEQQQMACVHALLCAGADVNKTTSHVR